MEDGNAARAQPLEHRALHEPEAGAAKDVCGGRRLGKWLDQTSDREEGRRDRVHGAAGIIPGSVWLVLFFTAGVVFAYMLFFADSGERAISQAMLAGSAIAVVTATLLAIQALDNPYRPGVGSLRPVAMERSLAILDQARAALKQTAAVPCDAQGRPARPTASR